MTKNGKRYPLGWRALVEIRGRSPMTRGAVLDLVMTVESLELRQAEKLVTDMELAGTLHRNAKGELYSRVSA